MRNHVKHLKAQLQREHWLALGFDEKPSEETSGAAGGVTEQKRLEQIGGELFMRNEAGNYIKLHTTPPLTSPALPPPIVRPESSLEMTSRRPKAAEGLDVDVDPTADETQSVKVTGRKTRPILQRAQTAVTSSTRSSLLDFRGSGVADVSRKGKSKKDEEDDYESYYLGMDISQGINTAIQPP